MVSRPTDLLSLPAPDNNVIYAKAEFQNQPTGTHYDRVYPPLFDVLEARHLIRPGVTQQLVETTSGNAGAAFAAEAKRRGYGRAIVFVPTSLSEARKNFIRQHGATLIETPAEQYISGAAVAMQQYLRTHRDRDEKTKMRLVYSPNHSQEEISAEAVGPIASEALMQLGQSFTATVLAAGNGTTLKRIIPILKSANPELHAIAFETDKAPVAHRLKYGGTFSPQLHSVYGTGAWGIPFPLLISAIQDSVDEVQLFGDEVISTQEHLDSLGYDVGLTSAAAYHLACEYCKGRQNERILIIFYDHYTGRY